MLLLYIDESAKFDKDKLTSCFNSLPGMSDIKEAGDVSSELEGVFSVADDCVITRLSSDFKTISIHRTGKAAVNCVVALQELYGAPLHLIDMNYSFDIVIDGNQTPSFISEILANS